MSKYIALSITVLTLLAGNTHAQEIVSGNTVTKSKQHFPVIIQNEVISAGVCRLHYSDGTFREVSCKRTTQAMT